MLKITNVFIKKEYLNVDDINKIKIVIKNNFLFSNFKLSKKRTIPKTWKQKKKKC